MPSTTPTSSSPATRCSKGRGCGPAPRSPRRPIHGWLAAAARRAARRAPGPPPPPQPSEPTRPPVAALRAPGGPTRPSDRGISPPRTLSPQVSVYDVPGHAFPKLILRYKVRARFSPQRSLSLPPTARHVQFNAAPAARPPTVYSYRPLPAPAVEPRAAHGRHAPPRPVGGGQAGAAPLPRAVAREAPRALRGPRPARPPRRPQRLRVVRARTGLCRRRPTGSCATCRTSQRRRLTPARLPTPAAPTPGTPGASRAPTGPRPRRSAQPWRRTPPPGVRWTRRRWPRTRQ